ncbi:uncharacterized transmembrane protein DDB_G0289901-like [Amphibalanus amphitrite]|uniref:uncharacterized transmembrane protein DDB_G0289901-like n=1 Tax=Amphibalanus amphitrite TaxID=1232801 RepID=UPI001C925B3D|nr:uncharacterized transmembrane protein DDB_G0289901-like [Amphibalanus amphitrite]
MTSGCLMRHLLLAAVVASAASLPFGNSGGQSSSRITFVENRWSPGTQGSSRRPSSSPGGSVQFGQTSATSNQHSTGNTQTNQGEASAVSVQQQSGLGGATQTTNNQAVINALQQAAGGGAGGAGSGEQSSNNQVNINSSQLQQNVEGTLVNVNSGNKGVVIVNTNDPETGIVTGQKVVNNRPIAQATAESSTCLYTCRRSTGQLYCCDYGKNRGGPPEIHGGQCPPARLICPNGDFFRRCAHDGQCASSDKCCYDACANHHICKPPVVA